MKRRLACALVALGVGLVGMGIASTNARLAHAEASPDAGAPSREAREKLEGAKLDALLAEIARVRKPVKTLRASFTQERSLRLLASSVTSTGQMIFVAPDRLRWELAAPDDVVYWVGPEGLSYRARSSKAATAPAGADVARALVDLRAIIAGDLGALRERYTLAASRGESDVEIVGAAREGASTSVRAFTLVLDKTLVLPRRARLVEGKNDTIDITFTSPTIDTPVDPALMRP